MKNIYYDEIIAADDQDFVQLVHPEVVNLDIEAGAIQVEPFMNDPNHAIQNPQDEIFQNDGVQNQAIQNPPLHWSKLL